MNKAKGSFFRSSMANVYISSSKSDLFTTRTVDELLWGYEDPLLARIASSSKDVDKVFGLMYKVSVGLTKYEISAGFLAAYKGNRENLF